VGRFNREDIFEDFEDFEIDLPEHVHPLYDDEKFPYDFMILKLDKPSTKPYIRLNNDPNLPSGVRLNEVTALGFGATTGGQNGESATILQKVDVTYVPNEICEKAKDPSVDENYQGLITADMLCAGDNGQDSCQGDSGGPLIMQNEDVSSDILIGVVSWWVQFLRHAEFVRTAKPCLFRGIDCAHPAFPGVYGRVSNQFQWIVATICAISTNPPPELGCDANDSGGGALLSTIPVTVRIELDDFPLETSWSIVDRGTGRLIVQVPAGTYFTKRQVIQETLFVPAGSTCVFDIADIHGDGLCCNSPGNFVLYLGRNTNGEVLLSGGGDFGDSESAIFTVPEVFEDSFEDDLILEEGQLPLTIVIQLDNYPQEIGWRMDKLGIEVENVIRVPSGIYTIPQSTVVRTVVVEEGELYSFSISDVVQDGITDGFGKSGVPFVTLVSQRL